MTPDEVRKLDNRKCIFLIRGCDPVIDFKFNTFKHPMFNRSGDGEDGKVTITTITVEELIRLGSVPPEK